VKQTTAEMDENENDVAKRHKVTPQWNKQRHQAKDGGKTMYI
jgi:hypothetical protein